jgi:hypothetical protein
VLKSIILRTNERVFPKRPGLSTVFRELSTILIFQSPTGRSQLTPDMGLGFP